MTTTWFSRNQPSSSSTSVSDRLGGPGSPHSHSCPAGERPSADSARAGSKTVRYHVHEDLFAVGQRRVLALQVVYVDVAGHRPASVSVGFPAHPSPAPVLAGRRDAMADGVLAMLK